VQPKPFKLERYFARYEFNTRYVLSASDPEAVSIKELLALEPGAAGAFHDVSLGYTQTEGDPELRHAVASLYDGVGPDGVRLYNGGEEAIFIFLNAALSAGDHVIVQFPAYQSHYSVAESAGIEVSRWHSDLSAGGAPDPDDLEPLIKPSTRAILITTPNNPTGYVFDQARLDCLVEIARRRGLWIFADEMYRGSERGPRDRQPAICDLYERGVSLSGTSKTYGLPGLRIAWLATRDPDLFKQIAGLKDYLTICNSAPSEFLATLALRHSEELLERVRRILTHNLGLLDAFFARHADTWEWHRPRGGTTGFPRFLPGDTDALCAQLIQQAGVMLVPSSAFDAGTDRVRIGYGRQNLPAALVAFEAWMARH